MAMTRIFIALGVGVVAVGRVLWLAWTEARREKRVEKGRREI